MGARPQFIKSTAVSQAIDAHNEHGDASEMAETLLHTGQHYDDEMSDVFFRQLQVRRPAIHLGTGSGSHGSQTARMLQGIERVLLDERFDVVLVYGDTNSTLAGALAAAKLRVPVAHVEAGLRAYRKDMPEEINRVLTDHVSSQLFCPSRRAATNLRREGITAGVSVVGDVMYDVLSGRLATADEDAQERILERLGLKRGAFALATIHRAENTDHASRLAAIFKGLSQVAGDGLPVVFPLHPRTRAMLDSEAPGGVHLISPLPYDEMLSLMMNAHVVMTDSGGLQKEAYWLGTPCVTLRAETEWTETLEGGWNVLVDVEPDAIAGAAMRPRPDSARPPVYGAGDAAEKIVRLLVAEFGNV